MESKVLDLSPETVEELTRLSLSIQKHSVDLGLIVIKSREVESGLQSMYDYRQTILARIIKESGIDPNTVQQLHISPDQSKITLSMKPIQEKTNSDA